MQALLMAKGVQPELPTFLCPALAAGCVHDLSLHPKILLLVRLAFCNQLMGRTSSSP